MMTVMMPRVILHDERIVPGPADRIKQRRTFGGQSSADQARDQATRTVAFGGTFTVEIARRR